MGKNQTIKKMKHKHKFIEIDRYKIEEELDNPISVATLKIRTICKCGADQQIYQSPTGTWNYEALIER